MKNVEQLSMSRESMGAIMGNDRIKRLGKKFVEAAIEDKMNNSRAKQIKEKLNEAGITTKEDLYKIAENSGGMRVAEDLQFGNNAVLYTTAVASFVEKELRSELVSRNVIKDLTLPNGADSIKVPKGSNMTASAVSDDGTVSLSSTDYGSQSISTDLYGARDVITHELLQVTQIDAIADRLEEIGRSLALKEDDLIQAELQDATDPTGSYGDLSNYNYFGSGTTIDYDKLVAGIHSAKGLKMNPTDIVAGVQIMSDLEQNDEFSDAAQFASEPSGDFVPQTMTFRGLRVHESKNVADDSLFIVDRNKLGYFVEMDGVDTWDQRVNDKVAFEILGVKRFGVGLARPKAVYGLHQSEDTPT